MAEVDDHNKTFGEVGIGSNHVFQNQEHSLCEALWDMRRQGEMCDVMIRTKMGDINAHGVVLSAASPLLKSLILDQTTNRNGGISTLHVPQTSERICLKLLEYIYTGRRLEFGEGEQGQIDELMAKWRVRTIKHNSMYLNAPQRILVDQFSQTEEQSTNLVGNGAIRCMEESSSGHRATITNALSVEVIVSRREDLNSDDAGSNDFVENDKNEFCDNYPNGETAEYVKDVSSKRPLRMRINLKQHTNSTQVLKLPRSKSGSLRSKGTRITRTRKTKGVGKQLGNSKSKCRLKSEKETEKAEDLPEDKQGSPRQEGAKLVVKNSDISCFEPLEIVTNNSELHAHKSQEHKKKKNYRCQKCRMRFVDKNSLVAHNFTNHFVAGMTCPKEYICEEKGCNYKSYSSVNFNVHKRKLHLNFRPVCSICGKTYKHAWSLYAHMQNIHPTDGRKTYTCHICSKEFKTEAGVQNHMGLIHQLGPERVKLICPHCGYTCWTEATLNEHLFMKHGVHPKNGKTYKCKFCTYEVTQPSTLKKHEQRHSAEKAYKCHLCDKMYVAQFDLNKHLRTVHREGSAKLHKCPFCDYTSKWSMSAVREHIQCKHADSHEKRWGCEECSYRTNSKGNLIKHIRNVHKRTVKTQWTLPKVSLESYSSGENPTSTAVPATDIVHDKPAENHQKQSQSEVMQHQLFPVQQQDLGQQVMLPSTQQSLVGQNQGDHFQPQRPEELHPAEDFLTIASKNVLGAEELNIADSNIMKNQLPLNAGSLRSGLGVGGQVLPPVSVMGTQVALPPPYTNLQQGYISGTAASVISPMFLPNYSYPE